MTVSRSQASSQSDLSGGVENLVLTARKLLLTVGKSVVLAPSAVQAAEAAGSKAKIANWSLTPQVLELIGAGKVEFAEDQQPWLQGYLSVSSAIHYVEYNLAPGAAILTGPNFVTKDQVPFLAKLMKESVR